MNQMTLAALWVSAAAFVLCLGCCGGCVDDKTPAAVDILLTLIVVFFPLLRGEVFFWGLPSLQFVPWRDFAFETLAKGQLPLWNPYNGAGAPLVGQLPVGAACIR